MEFNTNNISNSRITAGKSEKQGPIRSKPKIAQEIVSFFKRKIAAFYPEKEIQKTEQKSYAEVSKFNIKVPNREQVKASLADFKKKMLSYFSGTKKVVQKVEKNMIPQEWKKADNKEQTNSSMISNHRKALKPEKDAEPSDQINSSVDAPVVDITKSDNTFTSRLSKSSSTLSLEEADLSLDDEIDESEEQESGLIEKEAVSIEQNKTAHNWKKVDEKRPAHSSTISNHREVPKLKKGSETLSPDEINSIVDHEVNNLEDAIKEIGNRDL